MLTPWAFLDERSGFSSISRPEGLAPVSWWAGAVGELDREVASNVGLGREQA
jgi:hypothetical protein